MTLHLTKDWGFCWRMCKWQIHGCYNHVVMKAYLQCSLSCVWRACLPCDPNLIGCGVRDFTVTASTMDLHVCRLGENLHNDHCSSLSVFIWNARLSESYSGCFNKVITVRLVLIVWYCVFRVLKVNHVFSLLGNDGRGMKLYSSRQYFFPDEDSEDSQSTVNIVSFLCRHWPNTIVN